MTGTVPEFSRPFQIEALDDGDLVETIAATPEERAALAERFSLEALDRLEATLTIGRRHDGRIIRVQGTLEADVVQTCVVTLEPVPARVEESFSVDFAPAAEGAEAEEEVVLDPENLEEPEPLEGGVIDLGELAAQHLFLALDPYPRAPGVEFSFPDEAVGEDRAERPFAALARLRSRS